MVTRLRLLRVRRDLKLCEVARRVGLNQTVLSRIERGQMWVPPKWRAVLAGFYGVSAEEICDERGWPVVVGPDAG